MSNLAKEKKNDAATTKTHIFKLVCHLTGQKTCNVQQEEK